MAKNQVDRLEKVLMQDKSVEPFKLLPALKADLREVLREYGEIDDDITLSINEDIDGYEIVMIGKVKRFKTYGF